MLWLHIHLPHLPLAVFSRAAAKETLFAVHDGAPRPYILAVNDSARAAGIQPGLSLTAAWALADDLQARPRDPAAERRMLETLAAWSGQFTSQVSIVAPNGLLLEVAGSLKLFGGAEKLVAEVREGLHALGHRPRLALAPTPLAATWLARAGRAYLLTRPGTLARALANLPVSVLDVGNDTLETLHGMGVRHVGDLVRLPREGLARRLGAEVLQMLDRAFGRAPDPRPAFTPPPRFCSELQLPAEVDEVAALLFGIRRLVQELVGVLRARVAGVSEVRLRLHPTAGQDTVLRVKLSRASRDASYLLSLLQMRLERLQLTAAVVAVRLETGEFEPCHSGPAGLFPEIDSEAEEGGRLIERLQARLGEQAVQGLALVADHRPEHAWRICAPGEKSGTDGLPGAARRRPLWLLPEPLRLEVRRGRPCLGSGFALQLRPGGERIESGWWDGRDVRRDYFIAEDARGARYWIYRELPSGRRWFLHGVFG